MPTRFRARLNLDLHVELTVESQSLAGRRATCIVSAIGESPDDIIYLASIGVKNEIDVLRGPRE
jgi:hypothetical protein